MAKGEIITAGGKVMKNVAGFDLFRPMARSMGTLGVLLKIAIRAAAVTRGSKKPCSMKKVTNIKHSGK